MSNKKPYKPLFPYFGGKSRIAEQVWAALGDTPNYIEPFFGSGAVLFCRPPFVDNRVETVNDADGMLANFWRAVQADPAAVERWSDWPVNENDLHARHKWLVGQCESLQAALEDDPEYYDAKIAGWWLWGICCWIGGGSCRDSRRGIPHLGDAGKGVHSINAADIQWFANRLRRVRVCCGDWSRITGKSVTYRNANHDTLTGVFLDPPYSADAKRADKLYAVENLTVSHDCARWALGQGRNPFMRIVLCGYEGEHDWLLEHGWRSIAWKANGGYASQSGKHDNPNARRERLFLSPHCLGAVEQLDMLG